MTRLATQRTGAKLKWAGITDEAQLCQPPCSRICSVVRVVPQGKLDVEEFKRLLSPKTKMVAFVHISNTLGCINPVSQQCQCQDCWIMLNPCFPSVQRKGSSRMKDMNVRWMSDECHVVPYLAEHCDHRCPRYAGCLKWSPVRSKRWRTPRMPWEPRLESLSCMGTGPQFEQWATGWMQKKLKMVCLRLIHWFIDWLLGWFNWFNCWFRFIDWFLMCASYRMDLDASRWRGAFGRLSICTTPENWSLASRSVSHSSHSDCSLCNVKFASSCSWATLAPRMWLSLALTSWWLPVPLAKGTIYWVFGHVPPKNLERSSFKFSNEHEGFHFCSPALQTWMLCFIYPQMTFTFMKSVVNESLMSLCHSWRYFWDISNYSWDSKSFSTWEFNFCSHVPFLSFSIHFSLVTQVTRCMAQPAWVSSGASPRSWRWVHTVDLFNGHIQQIPTNSNKFQQYLVHIMLHI